MSWLLKFDEPIALAKRQSPSHAARRRRIRCRPRVAAECLVMMARIAVMRALKRHHVREFNSDRKPHHWGKR